MKLVIIESPFAADTKERAVKERPLPFSAPMVRALIQERKTQTRRVVKPQPVWNDARQHWERDSRQGMAVWSGSRPQVAALLGLREECPYGVPGDRLWVKETWGTYRSVDNLTPTEIGEIDRSEVRLWYRADGCIGQSRGELGRWRPSIHMPRWASRITLEITAVRVERLQAITPADAIAEGIPPAVNSLTIDCDTPNPVDAYRALWESNPWVWVISFRRVAP